jgi:hypothetical protein
MVMVSSSFSSLYLKRKRLQHCGHLLLSFLCYEKHGDNNVVDFFGPSFVMKKATTMVPSFLFVLLLLQRR